VLKAFKYRLYPSNDQKLMLEKTFGCARLIYNLALECKIYAYQSTKKSPSRFELQKQLLDLKSEFQWLKEINSQSLQVSLLNLDNAYKRFFTGDGGFPKFKSKSSRNSFGCPQSVQIENGKLYIPKFKEGIEIIIDRPTKGAIRSATISKTVTNKYFVSVLCETGETIPEKSKISFDNAIGIDLGIKDFGIMSDGVVVSNPHYLQTSEPKLKHLQRNLSRKTKRSNRYKRAKLRLALYHEKISNRRNDFLHKLSTEITNQYDTICVETLNVKGMIKNHKLAKSISDVSWSKFISMLDYKCQWKGKNLLKIGMFEASSKTCHKCGYIKKDLILSDRYWICHDCGENHDSDFNASMNIKLIALKKVLAERQSMDVEASSVDDRLNMSLRPKKHLADEALSP